MDAAARGDEAAFEELVRRHSGLVLGLGRRLLGSREAAEDLHQEVFLRVHRSLGRFRGDATVKTWVSTVTVNTARNHHRGARRRAAHRTRTLDGDDPSARLAVVDASRPDPERSALSVEIRDRVESALAELPVEQREAILLREVHGLDYGSIASATRVSVGTVKSRLHRARAALQGLLADLVEPSGDPP